jgi:hypothetical protein
VRAVPDRGGPVAPAAERRIGEAQQRRRLDPPAVAVRDATVTAAAPPPQDVIDPAALSWLRTRGRRVVDENGHAVLLYGVNVVGVDDVAYQNPQDLAPALGLNDRNVSQLTDLWSLNVVRLPFRAGSVLSGTGSHTPDDWLAALDALVSSLAEAGMYVILAMQGQTGGASMQNVLDAWQQLAIRYQDDPAILFEIFAGPAPLGEQWPDLANFIIGTIRREHPAAVVLVGSASDGSDVVGLPLLFATGQPVHNVLYTIRAEGQEPPLEIEASLESLAQSFPVFASQWSVSAQDIEDDLGRSAELFATLFERNGIHWAAGNWNAEPRLVVDALASDLAPTRFGQVVLRARASPSRED